jgi:hypothetical protein
MRRGSLFKLMGDCESTSTRTSQRDRQPAPPANGDRQRPEKPHVPPQPNYSIQSGFFDQGEPISLKLTGHSSPPERAYRSNGTYAASHTYAPGPQAFYVEPFDMEPQATPSAQPASPDQMRNGHSSPPPAPNAGSAAQPNPAPPAEPKPANDLKTTPTEVVPSDDEAFEADLREILAGKKRYDANHRRAVADDEPTADPGANHSRPSASPSPEPPAEKNEHEIFERIAQSMKLANAYDLGSVALNQRFDVFDNEVDQREKKKSR